MACRRLASGTADDSRCGLQLKNEWYEEDPQDNYVKGFKQCKKLFTSHFSPLMYLDVHCLCRSIAQEKNIPPFYTLLLYARIIRNVYRTKIHSASLLCSDSPCCRNLSPWHRQSAGFARGRCRCFGPRKVRVRPVSPGSGGSRFRLGWPQR